MELECPFCHKEKVKTFHKESYLQAKTSRISAGAKTTYNRKPDTYAVLEDCPNCRAKKKDIQDYYDGKLKKKLSHEEQLKLWKKRGLKLILESS